MLPKINILLQNKQWLPLPDRPCAQQSNRLAACASRSSVRQPRGCHHCWNETLSRSALRRPARTLEPSCMLGILVRPRFGMQMNAQWHLFGGRRQMHRAYAPFVRWVILATGPQAAFMTGAEFLGPARHQVRASVTLTHPCQHAAAHLPCTRPPDACGSSLDRPRNRLDPGSRDRADAGALVIPRAGTATGGPHHLCSRPSSQLL